MKNGADRINVRVLNKVTLHSREIKNESEKGNKIAQKVIEKAGKTNEEGTPGWGSDQIIILK